MESQFLYKDTDVELVSCNLANKDIVVRCFICRKNDKVLMETRKFSDTIRVAENGLVSCVDRIFTRVVPKVRLHPLFSSYF